MSLKHEVDKVIVYERAGLLFIFNFHSTQSFTDYRVGVEEAGVYRIVLSSDAKEFGGFGNISPEGKYFTTPMEWNGRKNWLQVCRLFFFLRVLFTFMDRCISRRGHVSPLRSEVLPTSLGTPQVAGVLHNTFAQ